MEDALNALKQIVWLPADPRTSGPSMVRHWFYLWEAASGQSEVPVFSFKGPPPAFDAAISGATPFTRKLAAWEKYVSYPLRLRLKGPAPALYHILDHSYAHLGPWIPPKCPVVATVHDLIPFRFCREMTDRQFGRWRKGIMHLKQADGIMADSQYTKTEVEALLGIPGERITVVPLGVKIPGQPAPEGRVTQLVRQLRQTGTELVVGCLGSGLARKNLQVVVEAVRRAREAGLAVSMVRAGSRMPSGLEEATRHLGNKGAFVDLGMIEDQEVGEFYRAVDVLIMPSLYEGFGLPVLEAMAHGTAVICSSATSLPEVAGEAALMFDPTSSEALGDAIQKMMDPAVRAGFSALGLARAKQFPWTRTWEECLEVYRKIA